MSTSRIMLRIVTLVFLAAPRHAALGAEDGRLELVFACCPENDLYRVICGTGPGYSRHGSAAEAIQSAPVAHTYADGDYWDDTDYFLPATAETAHVTLYYQTLSKEYVEFLRDENMTNSAGQDLYDAWAANGKSAPVAMAESTIVLGTIVTPAPVPAAEPLTWSLERGRPNPFRTETTISYSLAEAREIARVSNETGSLCMVLVNRRYKGGLWR